MTSQTCKKDVFQPIRRTTVIWKLEESGNPKAKDNSEKKSWIVRKPLVIQHNCDRSHGPWLVRRNSYQKYSKMVMFHSELFVYWRVVNKVIIIMVTNRCPHKRRSNTKMPWGLRRRIMLVKNFNFTGVHGRIEIHLYFMGAIHQLTSGGTRFIYVNIGTPLKGVLSCVTYMCDS